MRITGGVRACERTQEPAPSISSSAIRDKSLTRSLRIPQSRLRWRVSTRLLRHPRGVRLCSAAAKTHEVMKAFCPIVLFKSEAQGHTEEEAASARIPFQQLVRCHLVIAEGRRHLVRHDTHMHSPMLTIRSSTVMSKLRPTPQQCTGDACSARSHCHRHQPGASQRHALWLAAQRGRGEPEK